MEIKILVQLILVQVSFIIVIIFILRMIFSRHLNAALRRLKNLHEEALIKEAQLKEELEKAKQEKLAEVEKGKQQAKRIVEEAKKEAEALGSTLEEHAKEGAQKILTRGKEELEKLKVNLMSEIELEAINLSTEMIRYTFSEEGKENLQRQLIDEIIQEISVIDKDRFTVDTDRVKVTTSFPLTEKEKQDLGKVLAGKKNSKLILEEQIDKELITGLVIEMGALVIDGSLKNKLRKVIPHLKGKK